MAAIVTGYEVGVRVSAARDLSALDTFSTGRWIHSALESFNRILIDNNLRPSDIVFIEVHTFDRALGLNNYPDPDFPMNWEMIVRKFREIAPPLLPGAMQNRIIDAVKSLPTRGRRTLRLALTVRGRKANHEN